MFKNAFSFPVVQNIWHTHRHTSDYHRQPSRSFCSDSSCSRIKGRRN